MSDNEQDFIPSASWYDDEPTITDLSSISLEPYLGVIGDQFSVSPQSMALEVDEDNVAGSALRTSNQLDDVPVEERKPFHTGHDLQAITTPTTP